MPLCAIQAALPAYPRAVRGVGGRGYSTSALPVTSPIPPAHHQHYHTGRYVHAALHQRTQQCSTLPTSHAPTVQNPVVSHQAMEAASTGSRQNPTCTPFFLKKKMRTCGGEIIEKKDERRVDKNVCMF